MLLRARFCLVGITPEHNKDKKRTEVRLVQYNVDGDSHHYATIMNFYRAVANSRAKKTDDAAVQVLI